MKTLLKLLPLVMIAVAAGSRAEDSTGTMLGHDYHFRLANTPKHLTRFYSTVYPNSDHEVYNLRGRLMTHVGDSITAVAFNPIGKQYAVITRNKKGKGKAVIMDMDRMGHVRRRFSNKKIGNPTTAIYSPDALNFLVANDTAVLVFDSRKYTLKGSMPLVHPAKKMVMSKNGYHLATTDGAKVTVYNYDDKSVRHRWDFESGVNNILFNEDDTEFAVLTDDGTVNIYDTRTFIIKNTIEEVGNAGAGSYNSDGKYMALVKSPDVALIINLLEPETDRRTINIEEGSLRDLLFFYDVKQNPLLACTTFNGLDVRRIHGLEPFYTRLVDDEVNRRMNEWLKRMPDESLEDYQARVNDESRARQRRLLEDEIATRLAPDMLSMAEVSLGQYDPKHDLLEVNFSNMPSIYLPVGGDDISAFTDPDKLSFTNAKYTVGSNDRFEMIYAEIINSANGKTYIYNNLERTPMNFMEEDEEEDVSLALIQQQQMEEIKLRELQEKVMEEAKSRNVISDHTNINVSTEVIPDYDANGNKILNYKVNYTYEVEPDFTAREDFGPGKYHINESGAASSMLEIVQKSIQGDLARYVKGGKKVNIRISGTADSSPIVGRIIYDGVYGDIEDEPVYNNGQITGITVKTKGRITENEQLAFLRACGVKKFLEDNVKEFSEMKSTYRFDINVTEGKGSQFRRITTEITFVDAL